MRDWNSFVLHRARTVEMRLWGGAAMVVLAVHIAGVAWLLRDPFMAPAENAPPVAIMIEFADAAQAVKTEKNEISPDQTSAEQREAVEEVKTADKPPVEDPVEEERVTLPDKVEVPLPILRIPPPRQKKIVKKEEPRKKPVRQPQPLKAASRPAAEAQAQVRQSDRDAARQNVSSFSSSSMAAVNWQSRLMAHLERRKRYPSTSRSRGEQGTAYVRFHIDDAGNVLSASLTRSSGFSALDREVLALVHRASPVPAPPSGVSKIIVAPVRFSVR
ncbi:MAG: energy transducer TonB [Parvibaculum sp.]|nr:energy transducer TonB [Parvibaculum sp.]